MNSRGLLAIALIFLLSCWGYSWIFLKLGLLDCGPFTFAALRTGVAGVFLVAMLPLLKRPFLPTRIPETLLLGLTQTALFVGLSQWSLVSGAVAKTAILIFTMPFWVLLFARFLLHERIVGQQWIAVALAALGLTCVLSPWQLVGSIESQYVALAAGAMWALSAVIAKRIQNRLAVDLVNMTAWQMVFGSLVLTVIAVMANEPSIQWTQRFVGILIFTGLISTALGWLIWLYLLKHLSAGMASMSILAVPVIAIAAAAWQLNERPPPLELLGMGFIIVALAVLSFAQRRSQRAIVNEITQE